jgi:putative transposase
MTNKGLSKEDKPQSSIYDFGDLTEDEKRQFEAPIRNISHENHIEDSRLNKGNDFIFDFIDFDEELKKNVKVLDDSQVLRSEQIYINDPYYNKIFSILCRYSKNLFNSSIYEIRHAQKCNFDKNADGTLSTPEQKELRLKISDILKDKLNGYQNEIYKLLDKYFRKSNNENYIAIPQQSAQQTIKLATDALFSNERSKEDYPLHPWDYTGPPGRIGYKEEGHGCIRGESIFIFTNQQCHIEVKKKSHMKCKKGWKKIPEGIRNYLTFPSDLRKILKIDVLSLEPVLTRLSSYADLRHVRIIPLYIGYKIEIVYTKVISEKLERAIERFKDVSKDRLMGIDIGVNNTMAIGCLDLRENENNGNDIKIIGNHPILIIGKYLKSINQWFNKVTSKLYSIYMKQQRFTGEKGVSVKMGKKFKILSMNRDNFFKDVFHKLSNFVIKYCIHFRIGTIVIDWSKGMKQNMNMGKLNNQNFAYIPFSTKLIMMIKYKARRLGIKVVIQNGAYTSLSSFPDNEPFDWSVKNVKDGGLKSDEFGRIFRGLFRTNDGVRINDDVMSSYNQIRKYRIAIGKPINMNSIIEGKPDVGKQLSTNTDDMHKINGVVDGMLRPIGLRIEKLLSEGSKSLISMIPMNNIANTINNDYLLSTKS